MKSQPILIDASDFSDALLVVRAEGSIRFANRAAGELLGWNRDELTDKTIFQFVSDSEAKVRQYLRLCAASGQGLPGALRWRTSQGAIIPIRCDGHAQKLPGSPGVVLRCRAREEATDRFLALNEKIGELNKAIARRKAIEAHLRTQREWFRVTLSSIGDAVIATDENARVTFMNAMAETLTGWGYQEAEGQPLDRVFRIINEGSRLPVESPVSKVLREGVVVGLANHTALISRDGVERSIDDSGAPIWDQDGRMIGVVLVFRDITEQKRTEEQVRRTQKLESLGVLAGGIAHDFNNLLTGVLGNASLALDVLPRESPARTMIGDLVRAGERAALLTRQLLAYAGKGRFFVDRIDLSSLVREIADLLNISIPKSVHLRLELQNNMPAIEADAGQLQQLVMNLVINGAEAIGENQAGTVLVTTGTQMVDEEYIRSAFGADELRPGSYIALEVQDTGHGMDRETMARIFDPFFTTKFTGRGLGLAAVLGIVRSHKGALKVYSTPGKGSTFKVLFPALNTPAAKELERLHSLEFAGTGRILIVDDEAMIRKVARMILEQYGYTVMEAGNGFEALELFEKNRGSVDLVLLDLTMPELSGEQTLAGLRVKDPQLPVVLCSGYNELEATRRFNGKKLSGFVQKPFNSRQLAEVIQQALARRSD